MTYPGAFLTPVETERKNGHVDAPRAAGPLFREYGAPRQRDVWDDAVPTGAHIDFARAGAVIRPGDRAFATIVDEQI